LLVRLLVCFAILSALQFGADPLLNDDALARVQRGLDLVEAGVVRPHRQPRLPAAWLERDHCQHLAARDCVDKRPCHLDHLYRVLGAEELGQFCQLERLLDDRPGRPGEEFAQSR